MGDIQCKECGFWHPLGHCEYVSRPIAETKARLRARIAELEGEVGRLTTRAHGFQVEAPGPPGMIETADGEAFWFQPNDPTPLGGFTMEYAKSHRCDGPTPSDQAYAASFEPEDSVAAADFDRGYKNGYRTGRAAAKAEYERPQDVKLRAIVKAHRVTYECTDRHCGACGMSMTDLAHVGAKHCPNYGVTATDEAKHGDTHEQAPDRGPGYAELQERTNDQGEAG